MIRAGEHLVLSLWDRAAFTSEVGPPLTGPGVPPVTLAHNVATKDEVDAVLKTAAAAGASPVHPAQDRDWGGYTGYFADPDGLGDRLQPRRDRPAGAAGPGARMRT